MVIEIEQSSCIRCGKCVKVCPTNIFVQDGVKADVEIAHPQECIACGHCVSVCPTGSVKHSLFPAERVHVIDYQAMPAPDQVMLLLKARRSNRTITNRPVPAEKLDMIVEAAHVAPTATNSQSVSYTLVTDPDKLVQVADYTIGVFDSVLGKLENPLLKPLLKLIMKEVYKYIPAFKQLKEDHQAGKDPILRKATALLFIHTPLSDRFGCENANLAYQNASIMAQALGVSQIYMGFVLTAIKQDRSGKLAKLLGIQGKIHAIMALGMPAFQYDKYPDREEVKVAKL